MTKLSALLCVGSLLTLSASGCSGDDDDDDVGAGGDRAGSTSIGGAGEGGRDISVAGSVHTIGGAAGNGNGGDAAAGETATGGAADVGGAGAGGVNAAGGGAGGAAGAAGGADDGVDRDAFRPTELPFTQTAFEGLSLPAGFSINVYRSGLGQARMLAVHGPHVLSDEANVGRRRASGGQR